MSYQPHPEFAALYKAYTGDPDSIGRHLTLSMVERSASAPMLVVTGADVVLFPGGGAAPVVESFRRSTRGFIELAAVSHLGTAVAWLARMRDLGDARWRPDCERLIAQIERTRRVNSEDLWRQDIAVPSLAGHTAKIVEMIDYCCRVTSDLLARSLADETLLSFDKVRAGYLDPVGSATVPVPINDVMVATFALAFLDIAHRIIGWVRSHVSDWTRLMVLLSGRSGRATAGVTWATNNMCHLLWRASERLLEPERVYIAPHAPSFVLSEMGDEARMKALEVEFREIWCNTRTSVELARLMFADYPAFRSPAVELPPTIDETTSTVSGMPALRHPDDRLAAVTCLRVVMEDPMQLLANSVAYPIIDQLCDVGNRPGEVFIPGFTNVTYPPAVR